MIAMYYNDHAPPHFHAKYGEHEATFLIQPHGLLEGTLPSRAARMVREWAALHEAELHMNWLRARAGSPLHPIPPLR
ncbi:MAG: DUF4160 domain-containing protein [Planctomycetota bacterium]